MITITWTGTDTDGPMAGVEQTHTENFYDCLGAARSISSIRIYENTSLVAVTGDDVDAFREYCATLKPGGVHF